MKPDEHDDIFEVLLEAGVHEGYPSERRKLVSVLMTADITAAQVRTLIEWKARTGGKAGSLAKLLTDTKAAKEAIRDIEAVAAKRGGPKAAAGQSGQAQPMPREDWREADLARRVRARVDSDRRALADVAAEFGLTPDDARRLLDVGRELCLAFVKNKPLTAAV